MTRYDLMVWNVTGLNQRLIPELIDFIDDQEIQIAVFVETHLPRNTTAPHPSQPHIPGMDSSHTPHTTASSGVAVYVSKKLAACPLMEHCTYHPYTSTAGNETAAIIHTIHVFNPNGKEAIIAGVYIPPNISSSEAAKLIPPLHRLISQAEESGTELIVCGDLNVECPGLGGRLTKGPKCLRNILNSSLISANRRLTPLAPTHIRTNTGYNRWQLFLPIQFNRYVKKLTPDVVIVHGLIFPWQILMLHFQLGRSVKIIAQHHAERPLRDIRQYFQRWADRYIDAYLFSSIDLGMRWVEKNQIQNRNKIKVIMGTSSTFYPIEKRQAKIKTNVVGDNIFLWVGRLDANKDPLVVAKAFLQFSKLHHGVSLYMIYQTNELEEKLKALVNGDEGGDRIHLVGNIAYDELLWWYNSADYIISSSSNKFLA